LRQGAGFKEPETKRKGGTKGVAVRLKYIKDNEKEADGGSRFFSGIKKGSDTKDARDLPAGRVKK